MDTADSYIIGSRLYDPIPSNKLQQVRRLAYDLAWGALYEFWSADNVSGVRENITRYNIDNLNLTDPIVRYLVISWHKRGITPPNASLLRTFGYISGGDREMMRLTNKAFELLEQPSPQSIFISYRRQISSAFAMYIWSSLQATNYDVFIDIRNILPGDAWHALLEKRVKESTTFICVIGKDIAEENGDFKLIESTESVFVKREIAWALESSESRRIIPILHGGMTPDHLVQSSEPFSRLLTHNIITVNDDTAPQLYDAVETIHYALSSS